MKLKYYSAEITRDIASVDDVVRDLRSMLSTGEYGMSVRPKERHPASSVIGQVPFIISIRVLAEDDATYIKLKYPDAIIK